MKRKLLSLILLAIFALSPAAGSSSLKLGKAGLVVQKFCRLDAAGKRLSSDFHDLIQPLVSWEEEPGWDVLTRIQSFKIVQEEDSGSSARVKVIYEVTAVPDDTGNMIPTRQKEEVIYTLKPIKGRWRITEPQLMPHVLKIPK